MAKDVITESDKKKKRKIIKIPELKIEVEAEIHDKGKLLRDIKIPKGWRLLRIEEISYLFNKENYKGLLSLNKTFEFTEQPFEVNKEKRLGSWFSADSGWAYLDCGINPSYSDAGLGVRFCREIIK